MSHQKVETNKSAAAERNATISVVTPMVGTAKPRARHRLVLVSLVVLVVFPIALTAYYLWYVAEDQFASTVGFSVRREEAPMGLEVLGGLTELSGSSSSDTDILYEFLHSQQLVSLLNTNQNLAAIWSKPEYDPVFAFDPSGTIEDLVSHWGQLVHISYDTSSKLIEIRVHAFSARDAQRIAQAIFDASSTMINRLSTVAREDAIRHARDDLASAVERLKAAREAVTIFRNEHQIVDPNLDLETQAGLLGNLQSQLADALITLDLLSETTRAADPRIDQANRKVAVITKRISEEKRKLGMTELNLGRTRANPSDALALIYGEYERLVVDREFAEQSYISALTAFDVALAEARRQSRYLAAHIEPTLAERALYPRREVLLGLISAFVFLGWATSVLVLFSLKDRR